MNYPKRKVSLWRLTAVFFLTVLSILFLKTGFTQAVEFPLEPNKNQVYLFPGKPAATRTAIVSLQARSENIYPGKYGHYCAGTMLTERWLITAAHCLDANIATDAIVGSDNLNNNRRVQIPVVYKKKHPDFNSFTLKNDLGLAYLAKSVNLRSLGRQPAQINPEPVPFGSQMIIQGWGATRDSYPAQLQQANVKTVSCGKYNNDFVCAKGLPTTCSGDSGGPLFDSSKRLSGIVSFSGKSEYVCNGFPPSYAGFTRLDAQVNWIEKIIGTQPELPNKPRKLNISRALNANQPPLATYFHSVFSKQGARQRFFVELISPYYPIQWARFQVLNENEQICTWYSPAFPQARGCYNSKWPAPMLVANGRAQAGIKFISLWKTRCPKAIIRYKIGKQVHTMNGNPCNPPTRKPSKHKLNKRLVLFRAFN